MIISKREFPNHRVYSMEYCGRPLSFEIGKLAELCNASVLVRYGETTVLVAVTASAKPKAGIDYFPLSVDFEEKLYSVGRIPGSFLRREGRPSEKAILAGRLIDRPMRPLFPSDLRNDVVITCTVLSVDPDCSPEIAAMLGASAAVSISDIPFNGPIGGVVLGYVDGKYVFNPTSTEREHSQMTVTVAATREKVVMIEAAANEIPEDVMLNGIIEAHQVIKSVIALIDEMVAEIGKPKFEYEKSTFNEELFEKIVENFLPDVEYCM
jgi:polyribonucleotide nucleotidyltransferase